MTNAASNSKYDAKTDATGKAVLRVSAGNYNISASDPRAGEGNVLNGIMSNLIVDNTWNPSVSVELSLTASPAGRLVIKELYVGGCQNNDNSGKYSYDQYVILYNNSTSPVDLTSVALGIINPYNSTGSNKDYVNGKLFYEAEGWIPAGSGVWYFTDTPILDPGKQVVIALNNAIDNTVTYTNSINFSNPDYYCTYDLEVFDNKNYYSAPSEVIPTSHYLKSYRISQGNAWVVSQLCPAFFIFSPEGTSLKSFIDDPNTTNVASLDRKKVPVNWVLDGIEVFRSGSTNQKRLTAGIDAGSVDFITTQGYTLYRNVDVDATKAIQGNAEKLVYNYSLGTSDIVTGSTDPSGIDAEASILNGARIVYKDTNNSTTDFHQRKKASLRN